jgi:hypothetical protein
MSRVKYMSKNTVLWGIIALCLALPGRAKGDLAPAQHLELAYDIYLGGILAASADIVIESGGKRYRINSTAHSLGILDVLIGFRRQNEVLGRIIEKQTKPMKYAATGIWAGAERSVRIDYSAETGIRFTALPGAVEDEREAVPTHHLPGTVDPFSALYQALLRHLETGECNGRSKVFDGRRRFDFLFEAVGDLATTGPLYSGLAQVCRVRQIVIAGFSQRVWLPHLIRPRWVDIWMAKVHQDLPALPARLEADAGLGTMIAHLVAIGGRKHPPGEGPPE